MYDDDSQVPSEEAFEEKEDDMLDDEVESDDDITSDEPASPYDQDDNTESDYMESVFHDKYQSGEYSY